MPSPRERRLDRKQRRQRKLARLHGAESSLEQAIAAYRFTQWSITTDCARALYHHCEKTKPRVIIDLGSGASTVVLARYVADVEATPLAPDGTQRTVKLISVEHDPTYLEITRGALQRAELEHAVDLRHIPLGPVSACGLTGVGYPIKDVPQDVDFVFIDGPPGDSGGRRMTLPSIAANLANKWCAWLHDGTRAAEQAAVAEWSKHLGRGFRARLSTVEDKRGVLVLDAVNPGFG